MSKVFDSFYFSAANNYGCEETFQRRQDEEISAAWELFEAEQDLLNGIQDNRPFEFIFFASPNFTTPLNCF